MPSSAEHPNIFAAPSLPLQAGGLDDGNAFETGAADAGHLPSLDELTGAPGASGAPGAPRATRRRFGLSRMSRGPRDGRRLSPVVIASFAVSFLVAVVLLTTTEGPRRDPDTEAAQPESGPHRAAQPSEQHDGSALVDHPAMKVRPMRPKQSRGRTTSTRRAKSRPSSKAPALRPATPTPAVEAPLPAPPPPAAPVLPAPVPAGAPPEFL